MSCVSAIGPISEFSIGSTPIATSVELAASTTAVKLGKSMAVADGARTAAAASLWLPRGPGYPTVVKSTSPGSVLDPDGPLAAGADGARRALPLGLDDRDRDRAATGLGQDGVVAHDSSSIVRRRSSDARTASPNSLVVARPPA